MLAARPVGALALGLALAAALSGCDDQWQDYNYKMTVWIGDHPYSTVRHVEVTEGSTIQSSTGRRVDRKTTGQAVIVETPTGPVFALLTPEEGQFGNGFYAAYVAEPALVPATGKRREDYAWGAGKAAWHNAMLEVKGPRNLPRTIPNPDPYRGPHDIAVWPMFVRFRDITKPATVVRVSPETLGVTRITIEVTDEDVTTGIQQRLPWLPKVVSVGGAIDGTRFPTNNDLKSDIGAGAFISGEPR